MGGGVGEVDIVDDQHHRCRGRVAVEHREQGGEQQRFPDPGAVQRRPPRAPPFPQASRGRRPSSGPRTWISGPSRWAFLHLLGREPAQQQVDGVRNGLERRDAAETVAAVPIAPSLPRSFHPTGPVGEQAGLPDPGLALDRDEVDPWPAGRRCDSRRRRRSARVEGSASASPGRGGPDPRRPRPGDVVILGGTSPRTIGIVERASIAGVGLTPELLGQIGPDPGRRR